MFKLHTIFSPFFHIILHFCPVTKIVTRQVCHQAYLPGWGLWEKMNKDPWVKCVQRQKLFRLLSWSVPHAINWHRHVYEIAFSQHNLSPRRLYYSGLLVDFSIEINMQADHIFFLSCCHHYYHDQKAQLSLNIKKHVDCFVEEQSHFSLFTQWMIK